MTFIDSTSPPQGLQLTPNFLPPDHQNHLLSYIDSMPWRNDLRRRVQHYGWRYDYRARRVLASDRLGELPDWLAGEADRLQRDGFFEQMPDQAIINEYLPGQGISAHVDCEPCFGDTIASLSLGSACCMKFRERGSNREHSVVLKAGSLLVMNGSARSDWSHEIAARKSDWIEGVRVPRGRRVSITFRTVKLGE